MKSPRRWHASCLILYPWPGRAEIILVVVHEPADSDHWYTVLILPVLASEFAATGGAARCQSLPPSEPIFSCLLYVMLPELVPVTISDPLDASVEPIVSCPPLIRSPLIVSPAPGTD